MTSLNLRALGDLGSGGLARPAAEKFAGAWLACSLVMARGNVLAAFSLEHMLTATICGIVGALVTVALLLQMDRATDSVYRQATIAAVATFIGDTFSHGAHTPPQWLEPLLTGAVSAAISVAVWHAKRWVRLA